MALVDLVKITSNSSGTGAITFGSPVAGYRGREVLTDGESYGYSVQQEDEWEFGHGTYLATSNTFVRSPIGTSNGGVAINLQPNAAIALVALAEDIRTPVLGNASTASALQNQRTIGTSGDLSWSVSFKGDANVTAPATISPRAVTNAKMADMPDATIKGVVFAGAPTDLSPAQVAGLIGPTLFANPTLTGKVAVTGPFVLSSLGNTLAPNGVYLGAGGNSLSFQTMVSSPSDGIDFDNQRGTLLVRADTSDDNNSEEQSLCILTRIGTGYYTAWATSTAYALGANVRSNGNMYRCTTAGTSAASGGGPAGKTANINDGSVVWKWINDGAIAAKAGLYNETQLLPGGGDSWAQAINLEIESGFAGAFAVNTEFDLTNNCGVDTGFGFRDKYNLLITTKGINRVTSCVEINTTNSGTHYAAIWGLHFGGPVGSASVIGIDSSGVNGIGLGTAAGGVGNPTFSDSVIKDGSTALKAINLLGNYASSAIEISGTTPAAIALNGTFGSWFIFTPGVFKVTNAGDVYANSYRMTLGGPASSSAPGTTGDFRGDANFLYLCVAPNTWKRTPLQTF
jgi:hypothetical protein